MTTTTEPRTLWERDLAQLGIEESNAYVGYQVDEDTIHIVVCDDHGYLPDNPKVDDSGADAWEWIDFADGYDRDQWKDEHGDEPNLVWIERYAHGNVRYAPIGESSAVDRQWDVATGVAVIRFTKPDEFGQPLLEVARSICQEYTAWCNGELYGIVTYERRPAVDAPHCPVLIPDEFTEDRWVEVDSCWGFLGEEYTRACAKEGNF